MLFGRGRSFHFFGHQLHALRPPQCLMLLHQDWVRSVQTFLSEAKTGPHWTLATPRSQESLSDLQATPEKLQRNERIYYLGEKRKVGRLWEKSKHGSGTKAIIKWLIMPNVMDHASAVHPWWSTWLHFACVAGQAFSSGSSEVLVASAAHC